MPTPSPSSQARRFLQCLRNPNGDSYRAEHLRDIGEAGLGCLYEHDQITVDELDSWMGEMLAAEPDPLAD